MFISGRRIGTNAEGMMHIQPFMFHKTAAPGSHDDNNSSNDDKGEENPDTTTKKNKAAGTIALELYQVHLRTASKRIIHYSQRCTSHEWVIQAVQHGTQ
jgi:hypothetical protein